ncbi:hypothetical protein K1719_023809 [Acacia pycnantha]|nr:hypothetical protein K1719_023809 [Acacia pycnantha]
MSVRGGASHRASGCSAFNNFLHDNGLLDMGFTGPRFTWRRGTLLMRLDRAICNSDWTQEFPHFQVSHLPKLLSDHRPVLINLGLGQAGPNTKPFRFLAPWISHPEFSHLVQRIWSEETDLLRCIDNFTAAAQIWNSTSFGAIGHRKRRLFNRIRGIQLKLEDYAFTDSEFLHDLDLSLQEELEEVCFQEELLWIQKSSSDWICLGDRNTRYYQMKTLMRRKRNCISQLKNQDGEWLSDEQHLSTLARQSFQDLYSLEETTFTPLSSQGNFPSLTENQLTALEARMTMEELQSLQDLTLPELKLPPGHNPNQNQKSLKFDMSEDDDDYCDDELDDDFDDDEFDDDELDEPPLPLKKMKLTMGNGAPMMLNGMN